MSELARLSIGCVRCGRPTYMGRLVSRRAAPPRLNRDSRSLRFAGEKPVSMAAGRGSGPGWHPTSASGQIFARPGFAGPRARLRVALGRKLPRPGGISAPSGRRSVGPREHPLHLVGDGRCEPLPFRPGLPRQPEHPVFRLHRRRKGRPRQTLGRAQPLQHRNELAERIVARRFRLRQRCEQVGLAGRESGHDGRIPWRERLAKPARRRP